MNYIGMDIHKQFTVAVVKDEQGNKLVEDIADQLILSAALIGPLIVNQPKN